MQKLDFIQLVEQRLATLEARLTQLVDHRLTDEVKKTLSIARIDLPFSLAKARYVLELVIRDIYQRELPQGKPKPLFNMIEALCQIEGLFTRKLDADINYIRINGNLMIHAQEGPVDIQERDVEVIMLVILNLVEWYLVSYIPAKSGAPVAPAVVHAIPPNPYRGLAAFREEDSRFFFGREREAADLTAQVAAQPLVAVVGASGSGKSSLVYAGLFPRLRAQGQWRLAAFRPQNRPFYELASVMAGLLYADKIERAEKTKELAGKLEGGQVELATLVEQMLEGQPDRLLLVVDQFEELYTLNPDLGLQQRFVDVLLESLAIAPDAAAGPGGTATRSGQTGAPGGLCLLFTLRADFMAHALACAPLAKVLNRYNYMLGPIDDADVRTIIEQPARQLEIAWEPLLIERILRDLRTQPAGTEETGQISLPLLEFTLEQLWQRQTERTLTHLAYEELGGVQRALSRHADTVLTHFDAPAQERLRHIFTQLVCPGEGTEDTRQVATKTQVGEAQWDLVSRLADERLVVTGRDAQGQDTVELIHEALLRHWLPLQQWVAQNRQFRVWQNRLRLDLREWQQHDHDPSILLRGARLAEAEERLHQQADALSPEEQAYIQASIDQREQAAKTHRRRQRRLITGLAAGLLVALTLASVAVLQRQEAIAQREQALMAQREADKQKNRTQEALKVAFNVMMLVSISESQKRGDPSLSGVNFLDVWESRLRFYDISGEVGGNTVTRLAGSVIGWFAIGFLRGGQGQLDQSLKAYETALRHAQEMLSIDPNDVTGNVGAMMILMGIGNTAKEKGDLTAATTALDNALPVLRRLADEEHLGGDWSQTLVTNRFWAAQIREKQGDASGAIRVYREVATVSSQLAAANQKNILGEQALLMKALSSLMIGQLLQKQGEISGALDAYRDTIESANELGRGASVSLLRRLGAFLTGAAYGLTADIEKNRGDIDSAAKSIENGLNSLAEFERWADPNETNNAFSKAATDLKEMLKKMKEELQEKHNSSPSR